MGLLHLRGPCAADLPPRHLCELLGGGQGWLASHAAPWLVPRPHLPPPVCAADQLQLRLRAAGRHLCAVHAGLVRLRPQVVQGPRECSGGGGRASRLAWLLSAAQSLQQLPAWATAAPVPAPVAPLHLILPSPRLLLPRQVRNIDVGNKTETLAEAAMHGELDEEVGGGVLPACWGAGQAGGQRGMLRGDAAPGYCWRESFPGVGGMLLCGDRLNT